METVASRDDGPGGQENTVAADRAAQSGDVKMAQKLGKAMIGAVMAAGLSGAAHAAPDLVIVEEDSTILFESCEKNRPLATGRIAIKNIGDSRAKMKLGLLTRYSRSMLAVYVPEHLDMIDNAYERSVMDARDQESIRIEVGKGVLKRGRFSDTTLTAGSGSYGGSGSGGYSGSGSYGGSGSNFGGNGYGSATTVDLDPNATVLVNRLQNSDRQDIQRALRDLGYYTGPIDGVFGSGVEQAIRGFQRGFGTVDGKLTVAQIEELSSQTGRALAIGETSSDFARNGSNGGFAPRDTTLPRQALNRSSTDGGRYEITLYAVVDPYNLVEESDETNNLIKFTGILDCN